MKKASFTKDRCPVSSFIVFPDLSSCILGRTATAGAWQLHKQDALAATQGFDHARRALALVGCTESFIHPPSGY